MEALNTYRSGPDETGHFGMFGGRFVAETLMPLILAVEEAYDKAKADPSFQADQMARMASTSSPRQRSRRRGLSRRNRASMPISRPRSTRWSARPAPRCVTRG